MSFVLDNRSARRLLLQRQGLCDPPHRGLDTAGLLRMITNIGFVQVDSINTVERAHHMILFARNQTYKPKQLKLLLETERSLFENWTHDAAIIPVEFYPYWQHRFDWARERLLERWRKWRRHGFEEALKQVIAHVENRGPTLSRDLTSMDQGQKSKNNGNGWWDWHPSKTALEFLWRTGELAVCGRQGFQKVYDLSPRVIPQERMAAKVNRDEMVDWACRGAMRRLGAATSGELAAFWDIVTPAEAKTWCQANLDCDVIEIEIETANEANGRPAFAFASLPDEVATLAAPPNRIRVISPFDPVLRDRKRAERLFDFDYRIEVFVPAAKRQYGYYVFPLLRGDRFIGRIDMKHDRADGVLHINGLWYETGVRRSKALRNGLEAELERIRRFTGADRISYNLDPAAIS